MTLDELKQRLDRYEWSDVEFKAARAEVPRDAYKTVSAFANTGGGHLVFGIEQSGKQFQIVGVADVDKVQNDFLSVLRGGQLLNRIVCVNESILDDADGRVLVCQKDFVDFKDAKACLAKADPEVRKVLSRLQVQELIDPVGGTNGWALKGHLRKVLSGEPVDDNAGSPEGLVTGGSDQAGSPSVSLVTGGGDQAGTPAPRRVLRILTPAQEQILRFCDVPQRQEAIMAKIGVTHRTHFRNRQLRPLLESGLLVQTHPENPTHPNQAYVVSPTALALLD